MKRLVVVLSGLLVLPAFAEVAPIYYSDTIEMSDTDVVDTDDALIDDASVQNNTDKNVMPVVSPVTNPRNTGRTTSSRAVPNSGSRGTSRANITNSGTNNTRNLTTRASSANATTTARATVSRAGVTRAGTTAASRTVSAPGAAANVATRSVTPSRTVPSSVSNARSATPATAARASIVQTDTVNTPLYTGRVGTASSVRARVPAIRMATSSSSTTASESTAETKAEAAATMDELAQMTDYCKAQYTQCMDNFCNVLDDNQGRCSCSANLKNYSKTENALKEATENLQNVAQQIQYIGLSGDEVETLFAQTEAELAMSKSSDNSQLKNDLDRIKNMIVDVKAGTASVTDTGMSFDLSGLLDFNISSTGFDLGSLFSTNNNNTSSISNQRGEQLYKTASSRCKAAVLNSCANQGVDISVITNSYDLEIDKQCIAYERSLTDANEQMTSTVRNAKSVLQKARLMVAQQKNAYDLRGCINALDTCMQDEFVCGSDYENCLDPTGKYVVNGEIVVGSTPGVSGGGLTGSSSSGTGLYAVWNYGTGDTAANAFGKGSVGEYVEASLYTNVNDFKPTTNTMAKYLQQKIGYNDGKKNTGMCMSVLNKCQDLTYTKSKGNNAQYNPDNEVVRNYLERVSMQIKAAQDELLADYAESCISDVSSCLSSNNYTNLTQLTTDGASTVAVAACRPVITSCMSATGYGTNITQNMYSWLQTTLGISVKGVYSSANEIKTQAACTAALGEWDGSSCSAPTNAEFNYGMYSCKYEGGFNTKGELKCCDLNQQWDSANNKCDGSDSKYVASGWTLRSDITADTNCSLISGTWNSNKCYIKN